MIVATANSTASVRLIGLGEPATGVNLASLERYLRRLSHPNVPALAVGPARTIAGLYRPQPIAPQWLDAVQGAIRNSTATQSGQSTTDGRWLSPEVALAAKNFFQDAADLLPAEPHIYSSREGDLVADYSLPRGTLTTIVSPTFVLVFAVADGVAATTRILETGDVRRELARAMKPLLSGPHGDVEASE